MLKLLELNEVEALPEKRQLAYIKKNVPRAFNALDNGLETNMRYLENYIASLLTIKWKLKHKNEDN